MAATLLRAVLMLVIPLAAGVVLRLIAGTAMWPARLSGGLKRLYAVVVGPLSALLAIWALGPASAHLVALPLLSALLLVLGGVGAYAAARALRLDHRATGSMVGCGASSNMGSIGGVLCLLFWGEAGYTLCTLARMLEATVTYGLSWPICRLIGTGQCVRPGSVLRSMKEPAVLLPLAGVAAGLLLRASGWVRPGWLGPVNMGLVMIGTAMLMVAVGTSVRLGPVGRYLAPTAALSALKFLVAPGVAIVLGRLTGLGTVQGGLPLQVLILLGTMPVAFNALVPPTLFGLDEDLANSAWLVTTAGLVVVLPALAITYLW